MLDDFFPTPPSLIAKMRSKVRLDHILTVLEPSAGKGDIADAVTGKYDSWYSGPRRTVDVIEINPDLQHILRGKGYNLIEADFLRFDTFQSYDLIIANFPFSNGDEHLQQALRLIERNGGKLVCLVNAETIRNPFTQIRRAVVNKLEDLEAEIEFLTGEFVAAERPTDVEVALINVSAPKTIKFSFILDELKQAATVKAHQQKADQIIDRDVVSSLIALYRNECEAGVRLIEEYSALLPHIQSRLPRKGESDSFSSALIELKVKDSNHRDGAQNLINAYLPLVRQKYWDLLINDPRYIGQYTSNIVNELRRHLQELTRREFNRFNIDQLSEELKRKVTHGVEQAILDLFDEMSRKFSWDESIHQKNVHYYNGWKTNQSWKINKKVIMPINGISSSSWSKSRFEYRIGEKLTDMVKVFDYLSADKADVKQLVGTSMQVAENNGTFDCDLRYFKIKFYKKGTAHITFSDPELLAKFNIFGSQRKGWLPPGYGKKFYEEMNRDERAAVDDFQGREAYEQVMKEPERYIVSDARALLGN